MPKFVNEALSPEIEQCAIDCLNCHSLCLRTLRYCVRRGGNHANADHIDLLLNCSEVSQATENILLSGDPQLSIRICELTADLCERCARSCDQFGEDARTQACAEACRVCAASCRTIKSAKAA